MPLFRLPRQVYEREIEAILSLGVELRCNVKVGTTVTLPELRAEGFAAVVLAVGLQKARMLDLPGRGPGRRGRWPRLPARLQRHSEPVAPMGRVVVIGGGNVAYDCARAALRTAGTSAVTLVSLEALHEMPADQVEITEGDEEGIVRRNRFGPVRFVEGPAGTLAGLEVRQVSRVFDEQRRFAPEMVPGTEQVIPCDTVLVAVGQAGDTGFVTGLPELPLGRGGTVIADRETGKTSIPWLWAVGDAALGPGLFISAIAQASRAAALHPRRAAGAGRGAGRRARLRGGALAAGAAPGLARPAAGGAAGRRGRGAGPLASRRRSSSPSRRPRRAGRAPAACAATSRPSSTGPAASSAAAAPTSARPGACGWSPSTRSGWSTRTRPT